MNQFHIRADQERFRIAPEVYGHFAEHLGRCIYEGFWVGEDSEIPNTRGIRNDMVAALKALDIPVLRWPGGCFADEYHWKDGVGPREGRKSLVNTHWGGLVENNHFGTHEFFELCEQLGADPYVCGNVGSGTVQEMAEWVEYVTFDGDSPMSRWRRENGRDEPWKLTYFGVGNENWGCGGNMRAEFYADLYRRYGTYVRNFSNQRPEKIAGGPNASDYHWTEVLMREATGHMQGLSLHYYTMPGDWEKKGAATGFGEDDWFATLKNALFMDELVSRHGSIMDVYDPTKKVSLVVDEWGTWYDVEPGTNPGFLYQQNTLRDALVAAIHLNIFADHGDRVRMANIAQTVNVLQAMALTDGAQMLLTPTYHAFEMMKENQGAMALVANLESDKYGFQGKEIPALHVSASKTKDGAVLATVCHLDPNHSTTLELYIHEFAAQKITARVLTSDSMSSHNTFEAPETLAPTEFTDFQVESNGKLTINVPAMALLTFKFEA
jgi:alpha-N-arabinofuranosidase